MSLKKKSKNKLISLRNYRKFILKSKLGSYHPNVNVKVFLILSFIRLKLEKKLLNNFNISNMYFECPQELTESNLSFFISDSFIENTSKEKEYKKILSEILDRLFVFYLNAPVLNNINYFKTLKKNDFDEKDHNKFLLINESNGKILNNLKTLFPQDFNDIFKKIILLAYK